MNKEKRGGTDRDFSLAGEQIMTNITLLEQAVPHIAINGAS
jgi:hypothetical protein